MSYLIQHPNASSTPDVPAAGSAGTGTVGYFRNSSACGAGDGTGVDATFLNPVLQALQGVLQAAGEDCSTGDASTWLRDAITAIAALDCDGVRTCIEDTSNGSSLIGDNDDTPILVKNSSDQLRWITIGDIRSGFFGPQEDGTNLLRAISSWEGINTTATSGVSGQSSAASTEATHVEIVYAVQDDTTSRIAHGIYTTAAGDNVRYQVAGNGDKEVYRGAIGLSGGTLTYSQLDTNGTMQISSNGLGDNYRTIDTLFYDFSGSVSGPLRRPSVTVTGTSALSNVRIYRSDTGMSRLVFSDGARVFIRYLKNG